MWYGNRACGRLHALIKVEGAVLGRMRTLRQVLLQTFLGDGVITVALDDARLLSQGGGEAEEVVKLAATKEGAAVDDNDLLGVLLENCLGGLVDGGHRDVVLKGGVVKDRR